MIFELLNPVGLYLHDSDQITAVNHFTPGILPNISFCGRKMQYRFETG